MFCGRVLGPGASAAQAAAQARTEASSNPIQLLAAAAPLLARARLRLRSERRDTAEPGSDCAERDRSLRALACRQDSEPLSVEDDAWLREHLAGCVGCEMAHAAMLEASVCYRAWP